MRKCTPKSLAAVIQESLLYHPSLANESEPRWMCSHEHPILTLVVRAAPSRLI